MHLCWLFLLLLLFNLFEPFRCHLGKLRLLGLAADTSIVDIHHHLLVQLLLSCGAHDYWQTFLLLIGHVSFKRGHLILLLFGQGGRLLQLLHLLLLQLLLLSKGIFLLLGEFYLRVIIWLIHIDVALLFAEHIVIKEGTTCIHSHLNRSGIRPQ